jgi:hypothetical protein
VQMPSSYAAAASCRGPVCLPTTEAMHPRFTSELWCTCIQALGHKHTAARAHDVSSSLAHAQDEADRTESGRLPSVHDRPPLSQTYEALKECLKLWPALSTAPSSEKMSSEALKELGDDKFRGGDYPAATSWYTRAIASAPCMLDVSRSCAQLARCSLRCSGFHTALCAAAAAVWIMLPAAQLHARFEKPLGVFVRLVFNSLSALGFTTDAPSIASPCSSERWSLKPLLESMRKSTVSCVASIGVPTDELASRVRAPLRVLLLSLSDEGSSAGAARGLCSSAHPSMA